MILKLVCLEFISQAINVLITYESSIWGSLREFEERVMGKFHRPANFNFKKVVLVLKNGFLQFGYDELKNYVNFFVSLKEFI
jgi:hypothetical protein